MPHQRRILRKRKSQSDVFSDECDDDGDSRLENDFTVDDDMPDRLQRQMQASALNRQPKSERQQIALLQRLTTAETRQERLASSTFGQGASARRQSRVKDINWRDKHGETKLHKLVTYGTVDEIEQLIQQGANVNAQDNADWTALHEACLKGLPDAVECLLKAGANVNIAGFGGTTPLHDGVYSGCVKVVELLLQYGADASQKDDSFKTPLEVASNDDIKKCLLDHLHRTAKASRAERRELCESASCTHAKVCSVDACANEPGSSFRQCSTMIPPILENCALGHMVGICSRKTAANRDGPFMLYGPYVDPPRLPPASVRLEESHAEPSTSSSLALGVDVFKEGRRVWTSPTTTPTNSKTTSASTSALTLSSTSIAALPSTSVVTLSVNFEARRRANEGRSDSIIDASDGVFEAGVVDGGDLEAGIFDAGVLNGSRQSVPSRRQCKRLDTSSLPVSSWALVHSQAALPCPVTVYEDISDGEGTSSRSGVAKTSGAPPRVRIRLTQSKPGPRSLFDGMNPDELNKNSKNSVVSCPSSQMPGGMSTGDVVRGHRFRAYNLPFFHSYSKTGLASNLPAAQFEESRWKTSDCAVSVRSGNGGEYKAVQPAFGEMTGSRVEQNISASLRECVAGNAVPRSASRGFHFETSDSGKAQVFSGHSDISEDSIGIKPIVVPEINNQLIHGPQDFRVAPDLENVEVLQKKVVSTANVLLGNMCLPRQLSQSLPGLRCDVCMPRTAGDTREGDMEICSESALPEVNNNSMNSFQFSPGNSFQCAEEGLSSRRGQSSDKFKTRRRESKEGQSIALNKFGRDVVVFLRKATVNAREMKRLAVQNVSSAVGADSEHSTKSNDHLPAETTPGQFQNSQRFLPSDLGTQSTSEEQKTDTGKRTKRRIVLCNTLLQKKSVPLAGSVLHSGQKERVFDWNKSRPTGTVLVDKSTMTAASDWDLNESIAKEQSDDRGSGNFSCHSAAETQTSIAGEASPAVNDVAQNVTPEAAAFQTCTGDWKSTVRGLSSPDQSSGFKKTFDICSAPAGAVRFKSCPQTNKPGTLVSNGLGQLCRAQVCHEVGSLPVVASYKATRQPKHNTELDSNTANAKPNQSPSGNGFATPKVVYPILSAPREPPPRVKILSICEEKLLAVHPSAIYRGELSEHRGKPFAPGTRLKSSTETLSCRKESAASVPGAAKNLTARKKNINNDRVGRLEDVSSELNSTGSDMDCNRLTGTTRRSAGFGSGVGSGCGLGKAKQTRISRDSEVLAQVKTDVLRGGCSSHQRSLNEDGCRSKDLDFILWHGLSSKTVGSLEALTDQSNGRKFSSGQEKRDFPKEFERFLLATREYSLRSPVQEICAPSGLDLRLRNLFVKQEKDRLKLKQEQTMRCERLLLTVEAEVIREYVEEEKRQEEVRPLSSCNVLCQQNYCSRSHENLLESRPESDLKSRLKGLKEKFLAFERDLHFQLQNEISVLHSCQVQEWERMLMSCQPQNPSHMLPELCVAKVSALAFVVSAFFDKLNL